MSELEPARTCSNPTATERIRAMLDDRGVEWDYGIAGATTTRFNANGVDLTFTPMRDGLVCSTILTPEQAIAATLGPGTCHETVIDHHWRGCGSCGYIWEFMYGIGKCERPRYCPNCGRKVVE